MQRTNALEDTTSPALPDSDHRSALPRRRHVLLVITLLVMTGVLAVTSLVGDSITFDETSHLTAGMSCLKTGDFRLAPEHPPLGKVWAALPLLFVDHEWPGPDDPHWRRAAVFSLGERWLSEFNDGQRLVVIARCMVVILLLATCLTTYALARTLFGPTAGLMALALSALSPTLLAHGRLVTTDVPVTLCTALVLLTFARLMQRMSWTRLLAAGVSLGACATAKLSWPLVLPAMFAVAVAAAISRAPMLVACTNRQRREPLKLARFPQRLAATGTALILTGLIGWACIWTCYLWRGNILAPLPPEADTPAARAQLEETNEKLNREWGMVTHNADGTPRSGPLYSLLRLLAVNRLLPDAYVLGLAEVIDFTAQRDAYLMGSHSDAGWPAYFPIAFLIKTPLPISILIVGGILALLTRRAGCRDYAVLVGLAAFVMVYGLYSITSSINIGHRHLLPLYPMLLALAGASTSWMAWRWGRWLGAGLMLWLLGATLWIHPHHLAYFNELIGGPSHGHKYLADSNIDWGQDLLRLAEYSRQHPDEQIKLSYFGSAVPTYYLDCASLPSYFDFGPRASLVAGTYVISVTQLVGVYDEDLRDENQLSRKQRDAYARMRGVAADAPPGAEPVVPTSQAMEAAVAEYGRLCYKRLLVNLRHREPDARVGYSLFVYHLTDADVVALTQP